MAAWIRGGTGLAFGAPRCAVVSTGGDGASHQACEDIAIARAMPNLTVLVPGDYEEARQATLAAARYVGPVYLRLGCDAYPVVPEIHGEFVIGRARQPRDGGDITLLSTGVMVSEVLAAAALLGAEGVSARVLHDPTIKPLDLEPLVLAARETRGFVTAEEHSIIGGLGEAIGRRGRRSRRADFAAAGGGARRVR